MARIAAAVAPATDFAKPEPFEAKPAGAATVRVRPTADAFSQFSGNMAFDRQMDFNLGNALFTKTWVPAPSSTLASDGLGPLYNARGCQDCHLKDGRGHVPKGDEKAVSLFLRLSVPGGTRPEGISGLAGDPARADLWRPVAEFCRDRSGRRRPDGGHLHRRSGDAGRWHCGHAARATLCGDRSRLWPDAAGHACCRPAWHRR